MILVIEHLLKLIPDNSTTFVKISRLIEHIRRTNIDIKVHRMDLGVRMHA